MTHTHMRKEPFSMTAAEPRVLALACYDRCQCNWVGPGPWALTRKEQLIFYARVVIRRRRLCPLSVIIIETACRANCNSQQLFNFSAGRPTSRAVTTTLNG